MQLQQNPTAILDATPKRNTILAIYVISVSIIMTAYMTITAAIYL